jgi:thioredoxin 1
MLSPIIESVADSLSGQINVVKVDVDKSPNLARRFNVKGIPTLLVVKDGNVVNIKTGMGTREQLLEFVTKGE